MYPSERRSDVLADLLEAFRLERAWVLLSRVLPLTRLLPAEPGVP